MRFLRKFAIEGVEQRRFLLSERLGELGVEVARAHGNGVLGIEEERVDLEENENATN